MAYGFLSTLDALNALKAKLTALQWNGQPAFEKVEMFDLTNIVVALQELLTYANRVCLIVHDVESFDSEKKGQELHVRQHRDVVLMIADRHFADRQKAMIGDETTPGAFKLHDLVLNNVPGLLQPGIYCEPVSGEQMVLEQKVRDELQGRVAFSLTLRLVGGNVIVPLGRQPIP